jgi:anti-sigma factor RsiW
MNRETQLQVQAYLDNELSPGEARNVSALISSDAEARDLFGELKGTREALVANEPLPSLPESREFYWSKIQRAIEHAEQTTERAQTASARPWWTRMLVPVSGAVALFAILLSVVNRDGAKPVAGTQSTSAVAAVPMHQLEQSSDVSTITFRSDAEGVTVVWITSAE